MIPKLRIMSRQTAHTLRRTRRPLGLMLACAILAALVLPATPVLAAEGKRPVIVSMGAGIGGEVTVSAHINPEGLETTYEIGLECGPGEPVPCDSMPNQRAEGHLAGDYEVHEVSLTLTGLQPGTYWFGVRASNTAGEAFRSSHILNIPEVPPGACPDGCSNNEPYKAEISKASIEFAEHQAATLFAEAEAKRHQTKEQEEQKKAAEMAARDATEEAELKQAEEREAQEATARERTEREEAEAEHPACRVPALKGDTLTAASRALRRAHCRLGPVHRPAHYRGTMYVSAQDAPAGKRLAHGARVALTLGAKQASHRRRTHQ
jgi:hypothetical protein